MRLAGALPAVAVGDLIDEGHVGVVCQDRAGAVTDLNECARELLRQGRGLRWLSGRLVAERPEDARELDRRLAAVTKGTPGNGDRVPLLVRCVAGRALLVRMYAATAWPRIPARRSETAVVSILIDPWCEILVSPDALTASLALTSEEGRVVASLVRGMTVREIAEATGRKEGSVRWHVKGALARTGARRQSDLVRMALAATSLPFR